MCINRCKDGRQFTNNKICLIKFCTVTDLQIKCVMFVFKNSRFGFDVSVVAGVEGEGDILQSKPLSVIPNYIRGPFGLKI